MGAGTKRSRTAPAPTPRERQVGTRGADGEHLGLAPSAGPRRGRRVISQGNECRRPRPRSRPDRRPLIYDLLLIVLCLATLLGLSRHQAEALKLPSIFSNWPFQQQQQQQQPSGSPTSSPVQQQQQQLAPGELQLVAADQQLQQLVDPMEQLGSLNVGHFQADQVRQQQQQRQAIGSLASTKQQQQQKQLLPLKRPFKSLINGKHTGGHLFGVIPKSLFGRILTSSNQQQNANNQQQQQQANFVSQQQQVQLPIPPMRPTPIGGPSNWIGQPMMMQHQQQQPAPGVQFRPTSQMRPSEHQREANRPQFSGPQLQQQQQQPQAKKHALGYGDSGDDDFVIMNAHQVAELNQDQPELASSGHGPKKPAGLGVKSSSAAAATPRHPSDEYREMPAIVIADPEVDLSHLQVVGGSGKFEPTSQQANNDTNSGNPKLVLPTTTTTTTSERDHRQLNGSSSEQLVQFAEQQPQLVSANVTALSEPTSGGGKQTNGSQPAQSGDQQEPTGALVEIVDLSQQQASARPQAANQSEQQQQQQQVAEANSAAAAENGRSESVESPVIVSSYQQPSMGQGGRAEATSQELDQLASAARPEQQQQQQQQVESFVLGPFKGFPTGNNIDDHDSSNEQHQQLHFQHQDLGLNELVSQQQQQPQFEFMQPQQLQPQYQQHFQFPMQQQQHHQQQPQLAGMASNLFQQARSLIRFPFGGASSQMGHQLDSSEQHQPMLMRPPLPLPPHHAEQMLFNHAFASHPNQRPPQMGPTASGGRQQFQQQQHHFSQLAGQSHPLLASTTSVIAGSPIRLPQGGQQQQPPNMHSRRPAEPIGPGVNVDQVPYFFSDQLNQQYASQRQQQQQLQFDASRGLSSRPSESLVSLASGLARPRNEATMARFQQPVGGQASGFDLVVNHSVVGQPNQPSQQQLAASDGQLANAARHRFKSGLYQIEPPKLTTSGNQLAVSSNLIGEEPDQQQQHEQMFEQNQEDQEETDGGESEDDDDETKGQVAITNEQPTGNQTVKSPVASEQASSSEQVPSNQTIGPANNGAGQSLVGQANESSSSSQLGHQRRGQVFNEPLVVPPRPVAAIEQKSDGRPASGGDVQSPGVSSPQVSTNYLDTQVYTLPYSLALQSTVDGLGQQQPHIGAMPQPVVAATGHHHRHHYNQQPQFGRFLGPQSPSGSSPPMLQHQHQRRPGSAPPAGHFGHQHNNRPYNYRQEPAFRGSRPFDLTRQFGRQQQQPLGPRNLQMVQMVPAIAIEVASQQPQTARSAPQYVHYQPMVAGEQQQHFQLMNQQQQRPMYQVDSEMMQQQQQQQQSQERQTVETTSELQAPSASTGPTEETRQPNTTSATAPGEPSASDSMQTSTVSTLDDRGPSSLAAASEAPGGPQSAPDETPAPTAAGEGDRRETEHQPTVTGDSYTNNNNNKQQQTGGQIRSPSSFCANKPAGLYADEAQRCKAYYQCAPTGHQMFRCNNQTQFNQKTQNCDWWYNVDCGGRLGSQLDFEQQPSSGSVSIASLPAAAGPASDDQASTGAGGASTATTTTTTTLASSSTSDAATTTTTTTTTGSTTTTGGNNEQQVSGQGEQQPAAAVGGQTGTDEPAPTAGQPQQQQSASGSSFIESPTSSTAAYSLDEQPTLNSTGLPQTTTTSSGTQRYLENDNNDHERQQLAFAERSSTTQDPLLNRDQQQSTTTTVASLQQQQPTMSSLVASTGDHETIATATTATSTTTATTTSTTGAAHAPQGDGEPRVGASPNDELPELQEATSSGRGGGGATPVEATTPSEPDLGKSSSAAPRGRLIQSEFGSEVVLSRPAASASTAKSARSTHELPAKDNAVARHRYQQHQEVTTGQLQRASLIDEQQQLDRLLAFDLNGDHQQQQQQLMSISTPRHQDQDQQQRQQPIYSTRDSNQGSVSYVPSIDVHYLVTKSLGTHQASQRQAEAAIMTTTTSTSSPQPSDSGSSEQSSASKLGRRFGERLPSKKSSQQQQHQTTTTTSATSRPSR